MLILFLFFFLVILLPPFSTLFPYTTLFRSLIVDRLRDQVFELALHFLNRRLHHQHAHELLLRIDEERSEEHTSELQSRPHLVCRLLLEKKKKQSFDSIILNATMPQDCSAPK